MHNLKNKLIEELKTYEEAAVANSGELSEKFVAEVALLAKAAYYLCKLEHMMHEKKEMPYGDSKDIHHHDHMKSNEGAAPNMFANEAY